jgi:hypothetical protein
VSEPTRDFDGQELKVLTEALSERECRVGPTDEYVADLRRRLLSETVSTPYVRPKLNRRVLLGSFVGACAAVILIAAIWFLNAEPAWASAIRTARERPWIHSRIEVAGSPKGQIWVSPERDIVAAKFGTSVLFFDYKQDRFARYDSGKGVVYRADKPDSQPMGPEPSSVSQLADVFRRSPGAPSLFPDKQIERWRLRSALVDGVPCDEYEIVTRQPNRPLTTLLLTINKRESLPVSLAITEGKSPATISHFDYPSTGPSDERSPLLGIPADAPTFDVDQNRDVLPIARSLEEERRDFDDYTAFSVTSRFDVPLLQCDVRRSLKRGNKWRIDHVLLTDRKFVLPKDHDQALIALRAGIGLLRFVPEAICDGKTIYHYPHGQPPESLPVADDALADSLAQALHFPERVCRPVFVSGPVGYIYHVTAEQGTPLEGLIRVDRSQLRTPDNPSPRPPDAYWLDPKMGYVAVRTVLHPVAARTKDSKAAPSVPSTEVEITLRDFKQSPQGFWYPRVVSRDQITRLYVDFTDIPSDEMFKEATPTP